MDGLTLRAEDLGLSDEILARVANGEPLEITRGGQAFAKLRVTAPAWFGAGPVTPAQRQLALDQLAAIRDELEKAGQTLTPAEIRQLRDDHGSDC